jgi:hypothetical protein
MLSVVKDLLRCDTVQLFTVTNISKKHISGYPGNGSNRLQNYMSQTKRPNSEECKNCS